MSGTRNLSSRLMRLALPLLLLVSFNTADAQPDTIPVLLQKLPAWHAWSPNQIAARGVNTILFTATGTNSGIWISTDRGRTFTRRDSMVLPSYAGEICLPLSHLRGQSSYGAIWQLDSSGAPEFSTDDGLSWNYPSLLQKASTAVDGVSTVGDLFWFESAKGVVLTRSNGQQWDTLDFSVTASTTLAWYDAMHGVHYLGSRLIARTHDGGVTWDTVTLPGLITSALLYPKPNVLCVAAPYPIIVNYVSVDTGHTWKTMNALNNIQFVRDSLWYGSTWKGSTPFLRSTDQGASWTGFPFTCPNGPTYLLFVDSEHGVSLGTAQTDDGGTSWDCQDTTLYAEAAQNIIPADFDASSYFDLTSAYGKNYVSLSTDRGATWAALFPYPTNLSTPWGVSLGNRLFIAEPNKLIWTEDGGGTFHTFKFNYGSSAFGYIQRTPDGTLWATNDFELYISRDSGNTWVDRADSLPFRYDSLQWTYTFKPVDSVTGFVKTSGGEIFRTTNAGLTWRSDSLVPTHVIDSRHWFAASKTFNKSNYTTDAGDTWQSILASVVVPVDTVRWLTNGTYTTDAGAHWNPIPGWTASFTAVDSSTAFSGGFPTASFYRLDMPFYTKAKPYALDFSVDDQTWSNVPLQKDTGWIQMPVVIHNKSVGQAIQVDFDSVSDPIHFYLAPHQSASVMVPPKTSLLGPDGLDSVWFVYQPTAIEQDGAKVYWHSPQVLNSESKPAMRTDSLHGNPSSASVAQSGEGRISISITPNPTQGFVTIHGDVESVTIANVLGEKQLSSTNRVANGAGITLDLSTLPIGTYFLRIETTKGLVVQKVVKE